MQRRKIISALLFPFLYSTQGCNGEISEKTVNTFDSGPETNPVPPLGRGVNLGDMLESPVEGDWGKKIQKEYFSIIKNKGFDTVRIPIRWSNHALAEPPYTIDKEFFNRAIQSVDWALEQKLNVIINVHHYVEILENPAQHQPKLIELWSQIANYFKNYPDTLYFEILNEPNQNIDKDTWNDMLSATVAAIRGIDTLHTLIIGGYNWNCAESLHDLQIPPGETNYIATFHFYSPFNFTHQGAYWANPIPPLGETWPGDDVTAACQAICNELDLAKTWSQAHGNIPVLMGEFGAFHKADMISRANWTAYVRKQAEIRGFSWTYWEFCSGFGVYDDVRGEWREPLVRALGLEPG